jgi:hypothetical protein
MSIEIIKSSNILILPIIEAFDKPGTICFENMHQSVNLSVWMRMEVTVRLFYLSLIPTPAP